MSRIDDEIDDRRNDEIYQRQLLEQELLNKKKKLDVSEFDRRMKETNAARATQAIKETEHEQRQELEQHADPVPAELVREEREKTRESMGKLVAAAKAQRQGEESRLGRRQVDARAKEVRDRRGLEATALVEQRRGDEHEQVVRVERRGEGLSFGSNLDQGRAEGKEEAQGAEAPASTPEGEGAESKVGRQGEHGQSKGGKGDGQGGNEPQNFRLNPALLPPAPLARPRDDGRSERLRQLANEIAQKIVERARVGRNAAGQAEFQLDLRSNVLSGLQIRVSAAGGRISALFSGSDRKVLAMLKENSNQLRQALQGRGLTLAELKFEARA